MKITASEAFRCADAAGQLLKGIKDEGGKVIHVFENLPSRCEFRLGRILGHLTAPAVRYQQLKMDLLRRYGTERKTKDDKDNDVPTGYWDGPGTADPKYAEFMELLREITDEEIECPYTVKLSDFGDVNTRGLIVQLGSLVVDDIEKAA